MKTFICEICGAEHSTEEIYTHDGKQMCSQCYESETVVCSECGQRIWQEENEGNCDLVLCRSCYDSYYTCCEECGALLHLDAAYYEDGSEYPYCHSCYERIFDGAIKSYSYKPEPIFYGDDKFYMGVELEVDGAGERILDETGKIDLNKFSSVTYALVHNTYRNIGDVVSKAVSDGLKFK